MGGPCDDRLSRLYVTYRRRHEGRPTGAPISGWQQTNSDTGIVRKLTDEQLEHYRETGEVPASADIPLVDVTDVASHQLPPGTTGFNGSRKS